MAAVGTRLKDLWAGRLSLADAFWTYTVFWGTLINIAATIAGLALLVGGKAAGLDDRLATAAAIGGALLHFAPVPYNMLALVGVWRSASRPSIPPIAAFAARAISAGLFLLFIAV